MKTHSISKTTTVILLCAFVFACANKIPEDALGVIVGSKQRSAYEAGQIAGAIVIGALFGVRTSVDKEQKIRASLVTRPSGKRGKRITVRITFQCMVWNTDGQVSRTEPCGLSFRRCRI